jgi:2'-5' RNA ligase
VPEAEPVVGRHRASLDATASWDVPAHVTVLYPFLPPDRLDDGVRAAVADAVASVPRFTVTFGRVGWFGDAVLWLAPEPDEPFRALTAAVCRRFPETPLYAGAHDGSTPHLTVGHGGRPSALRRAAAAVESHLPVRTAVDAVRLMVGAPEPGPSWRAVATFPLGAGAGRTHSEL